MISQPRPDSGFSKLERDVLEMSLTGDDPVLGELRAQLTHLTGVVREITGVGFYTNVEFDELVSPLLTSKLRAHRPRRILTPT